MEYWCKKMAKMRCLKLAVNHILKTGSADDRLRSMIILHWLLLVRLSG
jgi:hypothetical protein